MDFNASNQSLHDTRVFQFTPEALAVIRKIVPSAQAHCPGTAWDALLGKLSGAGFALTCNGSLSLPAELPNLEPLALHLVSFGSSPAANTVTNADINEPSEKFSARARRHVLQFAEGLRGLIALIEPVRSLEKATVPRPDAEQLALAADEIDCGGILNWGKCLGALEKMQIDTLIQLDTYFPVDVKKMVRCLTWITEAREGADDYVIAPYLTCVPDTDFHAMYYMIARANGARVLKVVVDNFLCEIPFEVQIPMHLEAMTVVIIAIPMIDKSQEQPVQGVKVMLYSDPIVELSRASAALPSTTAAPHAFTTTTTFNAASDVRPALSADFPTAVTTSRPVGGKDSSWPEAAPEAASGPAHGDTMDTSQ